MTISEYKEIRDNILYPQNLEDKKQQDDKGKDIDPLNFLNVKSVFNNDPESTNKFNVSPRGNTVTVTDFKPRSLLTIHCSLFTPNSSFLTPHYPIQP